MTPFQILLYLRICTTIINGSIQECVLDINFAVCPVEKKIMPKIEVFYLFKIVKLAERSETIILGTLGILVHFRHLKSYHPPHQI